MPEIIVKLGDNVVHKYYFDKDVISIGRARDNDIVIENLAVSRNHARIRRENTHFVLTDLNSANGTYVNGVRVTKTEVMNDDVITVGKHYLHFINKDLSDEQIISDAFGAERTMIVEKVANATLTIIKGKQQGELFNVTKYETYVGRASDNDIRIHDWFVSKKHAVIVRQGQKFFIRDLGSWRGTMVNSKQIKDAELKDGDMLAFGTTQLEFKMQGDEMFLIEGRKPQEMIGDDMPEAASEPVMATGTPSPEAREMPRDLSDSFVQEISHPAAGRDGHSVTSAESADLLDDDFILQSDGEDEAPVPPFGEPPAPTSQDVIYVEDDDKEPFTEQEVAESMGYHEPTTDMVIETPMPQDEPYYEEEALTTANNHQTAVTEEQPPPVTGRWSQSDAGDIVPRQEQYDLPDNLPPDVEVKLVKMWLRALTNKSSVVRKQAAKELKKLTGITYEWQ